MKNAFRTGERVILRPLEVEEVPLFQAWLNDPGNLQYLQRVRPLNAAEERRWLETLHERTEEHSFGVALREGERLIGTCGLRGSGLPNRSADLGILIGEPAAQGKGYGSEAIRLLLGYGFETLGLHRVELHVYANNARGIRCYEGCGFRREGVRRESRWWGGRWWDTYEYAILENEWRENSSLPRNAAR
ncbi:MAG TPA: GNAT family protein [Planctomycetota bacterium]|nr:GNAT family protein [Planctomycetota bacterium]